MPVNKQIKFYAKIIVALLFVSTGFMYYVANRKITVNALSDNLKIRNHALASKYYQFSTRKSLYTPPIKNRTTTNSDGKFFRYGDGTETIKLAVVLCGQRVNQTLLTLRSAVFFSKENLHFIIIADEYNQESLKNKLLEWPSYILNHISFEIHPIKFPSGAAGEEWKKLFKLCACQRLFLPSLLHHIDSLIYVDTDILFMHPIEKLWDHFFKMNHSHIAALCPEHEDFSTGWYNRFARHPFYEPLGVNSGVMLMNLTRMRIFQWEKYLPSIMKEYRLNIVWGDQDIINIIFHYHPDKLYLISCEWNYRPDHCMYSSACKSAEKNGVFVIHGNRGVFNNNKQPAFKTIYQIMSKLTLGTDMTFQVFQKIKQSLKKTNTNCGSILFSIFEKMDLVPSSLLSKTSDMNSTESQRS